MSLALQVQGLACRRGRRLLFQGLGLGLAPGSITWLRGANGSGKTSLLRLLAGLAPPEAGTLQWQGLARLYVSHANALKDDLTLAESVAFMARLQGYAHGQNQADACAARALATLGMAHRAAALVRTLSQGQRRRGALARLALDDTPRAWLLDEPYDALDSDGTQRLDALIRANAARGGLVLLTSHQPIDLAGAATLTLPEPPPERVRRAA